MIDFSGMLTALLALALASLALQAADRPALGEPALSPDGAQVAFVPGRLFHLWHGETENRGYKDRYQRLERFAFDPFADIAMDGSGVWQWNSDKREMHAYLRDYFVSRREDG